MPHKKQKLNDAAAEGAKRTTQPRNRRTTRSTVQPIPEITTRKDVLEVGSSTVRRRDEEAGKERRRMGASLVNNVLALADTLGVKEGVHVDADQLLFLDTVRVMAIVPQVAMVPATDVYEKILSGIQQTKSLQVTVASFRLLHDLDLRHPQVTVKSSGTASEKSYEFVDNKEHVWSPFEHCLQIAEEAGPSRKPTKVPTDLLLLLESIADDLDGGPVSKTSKRKGTVVPDTPAKKDPLSRLVQFLMLQWLVSLLDSDFQARQRAFQGDLEKLNLVQESLIRHLLMGPYNTDIKDLFQILMRIIARLDKDDEGEDEESEEEDEMETENRNDVPAMRVSDDHPSPSEPASTSSSPDFFVAETDFCHLAATLLSMILELDSFKAPSYNRVGPPRKGTSRVSLMEILMDTLQYNDSLLSPLLQALDNPRLKLKVILVYFVHHAPGKFKDELRSIGTAREMFDCVAKARSDTNVCVGFSSHELQLLLANAFQVFLEMQRTEQSDDDEPSRNATVTSVCKSLRAAFNNLRRLLKDNKELNRTALCAIVIADALSNP